MTSGMIRKTIGYSVIVALGGLGGWCYRGQRVMNQAEGVRQETRSVTSQEARDLAARLNADATWAESLYDGAYTIELAQAMMPSDSTPILFTGTVVDIENRDSLTVVEFSSSWNYSLPPIKLRVNGCDQSVLRSLLDSEDRYLWEWAVVSQIDSIGRIPTIHEVWEDDVRVASGDCRAIIRLPEGYEGE